MEHHRARAQHTGPFDAALGQLNSLLAEGFILIAQHHGVGVELLVQRFGEDIVHAADLDRALVNAAADAGEPLGAHLIIQLHAGEAQLAQLVDQFFAGMGLAEVPHG